MIKWKRTTLGQVVSEGNGLIQTGPFGSQLHASDYVENGIPCIMPANMKESRVNLSGIARISVKDAQRLSQHLVKPGDIVYSRRGDITQKVLIHDADNGFFCGTGCILIRPGNNVDSRFLTYFLGARESKEWLINHSVGITMPNLNTKILFNLPLRLPSKNHQIEIADILSAIDKKIEVNNRINAELEAMAKTLYDYWFVQFDFPDENGKPYKSSGGKMLYSKALKREMPAGWDVKSLWDIAKYHNGLAMQKYRPTGLDFLRVIKIKEMNDGYSDNTEKASPDIPKNAVIEDGDVLFSWSATLDVMIWSRGKGALNQHIFKVVSGIYPRSFFYYEILNYLNHFKMMAEKRKTTMGHITLDHLRQSRIVVPPIDLIQCLDRKIIPIFSQHLTLEKENQRLVALRDWLLPMLMNGQVRVESAADDLYSQQHDAGMRQA